MPSAPRSADFLTGPNAGWLTSSLKSLSGVLSVNVMVWPEHETALSNAFCAAAAFAPVAYGPV